MRLYALEASLLKVDESKPAFYLKIVCQPAEPIISGPEGPQQISETGEKYKIYFQGLIDELREKHKFTNARIAQPQNWYAFASENTKIFRYDASFAARGRVRTGIYLDCGDKLKNEQIFDCLFAQKEQIEQEMGTKLSWERLEDKRACRIVAYRDGDIDAVRRSLQRFASGLSRRC